MTDPKKLAEWKMSTAGKLFAAATGAWLLGQMTRTKIKATPREVEALKRALMASRRFQDELRKPGATPESVINKLGLKHATSREFERITGVPFPI